MPVTRRGSCRVARLCCWGWGPLTADPSGLGEAGPQAELGEGLQSLREEASAGLEGGHRLASIL